jgi:4-amino-4-deoxy-L-arabinose transferase-like glycosyltransferase
VKRASEVQRSWRGFLWPMLLCALSSGPGTRGSNRLSYHEAFVAQGAREIVTSGSWWHPTIGGLPWLEKPPLPFWLVAGLGWWTGTISAVVARVPSVVAAMILVLGVSLLGTSCYGSTIGILAGAVQATTAWTVCRGRLAEADILLVCVVTWAVLAFDRMRGVEFAGDDDGQGYNHERHWRLLRWVFFILVGMGSLVKGIGFGAVLVLAVVGTVIVWDRDRVARQRLVYPAGWIVAGLLTLVWPVAMIAEHGFRVVNLWVLHIAERLRPSLGHGPFAGESWGEYALNVLGQGLPWTPLALIGIWQSRKWVSCKLGSDCGQGVKVVPSRVRTSRLLCSWALVPLLLVSATRARNAHYAIYAMVPWSMWSAVGLVSLQDRVLTQGWSAARLKRGTITAFTVLAVLYGLGFWVVGPPLDRRGSEVRFYESVAREVPPGEPLTLLYDDWDREPYPTPFGPIPHDLAVRLYYLNRPACWHFDTINLTSHGTVCCPQVGADRSPTSLAVISRRRDLPKLKELGYVEVVCECLETRWDRTYLLARVWPGLQSRPLAAAQ